MAGVIGRLKGYFVKEFSPEKLKWSRIVEDEKKARNCPECGRFGFYIHLPTSIREYWWGIYRCKGCKTEYRPKFTKGNLFLLILLACFYFQYFGNRGFTYKSYLTMIVCFAFAIGVNLIYSRMSKGSATATSLLLGAGWLLVAAVEIVLAHHGEGVATGNPKDIMYLLGSTAGFTLAGGSLLGLIPGVQTTFEAFLNSLLSEEGKSNMRPSWSLMNRPSPDHEWNEEKREWVKREGAEESYDDRPEWSEIHRKSYDDKWDSEEGKWVSADEAFKKRRQEMEDNGYTYHEETDAFIKDGIWYDEESRTYLEDGVEYDKHTKTFRDSVEEVKDVDIEEERGDAAKPHVGPGWIMPGDRDGYVMESLRKLTGLEPGEGSYEKVYKNFRDRIKYLEGLQDKTADEYKKLVGKERKARDSGDKWLEEKLRKQREKAGENVRKVRNEKTDLTNRFTSGSEGGKQHKAYEKYYRNWKADEVKNELFDVVKRMVIPDVRHLKPLLENAVEARKKLEESLHKQPELFKKYDKTMEGLRDAYKKYEEAQKAGDKKTMKALSGEINAGKGRLRNITDEMNKIHKRSLRWQVHSGAVSAGVATSGLEIAGTAGTQINVGKNIAKRYLYKPGIKRASMIDEDGDIIGAQKTKAGDHVADGSAASPEDISRRKNYEFYGVDKNGKIRKLEVTGNVDEGAHPNEGIFIRDRRTGQVSPHKFHGEGTSREMHPGVKNRILNHSKRIGDMPGDEVNVSGQSRATSASSGEGASVSASSKSGAPSGEGKTASSGHAKEGTSGTSSRGGSKSGGPSGSGGGRGGGPDDPDLSKLGKGEPIKSGQKPIKPTQAQEASYRGEAKAKELKRMKPVFEKRDVRNISPEGKPGSPKEGTSLKGYVDEDGNLRYTDIAEPEPAKVDTRGADFDGENAAKDYLRKANARFKEIDDRINEATSKARSRIIEELSTEHRQKMVNERWDPNKPGFEDELSKRIGGDRRHSVGKVQDYIMEDLVRGKKTDILPDDMKWHEMKLRETTNAPPAGDVKTKAPPPSASSAPAEAPSSASPGASVQPKTPSAPPSGEAPASPSSSGAEARPPSVPPSGDAPAPPSTSGAEPPAPRTDSVPSSGPRPVKHTHDAGTHKSLMDSNYVRDPGPRPSETSFVPDSPEPGTPQAAPEIPGKDPDGYASYAEPAKGAQPTFDKPGSFASKAESFSIKRDPPSSPVRGAASIQQPFASPRESSVDVKEPDMGTTETTARSTDSFDNIRRSDVETRRGMAGTREDISGIREEAVPSRESTVGVKDAAYEMREGAVSAKERLTSAREDVSGSKEDSPDLREAMSRDQFDVETSKQEAAKDDFFDKDILEKDRSLKESLVIDQKSSFHRKLDDFLKTR